MRKQRELEDNGDHNQQLQYVSTCKTKQKEKKSKVDIRDRFHKAANIYEQLCGLLVATNSD